jgi:hypothetical protein
MSIGDNSLLGDVRWGGLFGIDAEFIAAEDVKVNELAECNRSLKALI